MKPKPTLKTIAQLSGFAVPTVSRALSDAPDIAQATRERVQAIAREIGYSPNRGGLRLRTGKTFTIALVLGIEDRVSDHAGRLIASVANTLRATPYNLIVTTFSQSAGDPLGAVKQVVENGLADAILIEQIEPRDARVRYMLDAGFPFAMLGRCEWPEPMAYYDFDNRAFGEIAARGLLARGRRRLMCLAPPAGQSYARHLREGIEAALAPDGAQFEMFEGVLGNPDRAACEALIAGQLTGAVPPDGLICCSTSDALAALKALRASGLAVGRDVDIYTKETIPLVRDFAPEVMSLTEDVEAAGRFLAQAAITAIEQPKAAPPQRLAVPEG